MLQSGWLQRAGRTI